MLFPGKYMNSKLSLTIDSNETYFPKLILYSVPGSKNQGIVGRTPTFPCDNKVIYSFELTSCTYYFSPFYHTDFIN